MEGVHLQTPLLFAGASTPYKHRLSLCPGKTGNEKHVHFDKSWGLRGKDYKLRKHIFALYSFPIIFSQIFAFAALARLRFIPHLNVQACNVLYQPHLYFLNFWESLS